MALILDNKIENTKVSQLKRGNLNYKITITPKTGYKIVNVDDVIWYTVGDGPRTAYPNVEQDGTEATVDIYGSSIYADRQLNEAAKITLTGKTESLAPTEPIIESSVENADVTFEASGPQWKFIVTCKEGYRIRGTLTGRYTGAVGTAFLNFSYNDDKTVGTSTAVTIPDLNNHVYISGVTEAWTPTPPEPTFNVVNNISGTTERHSYSDGVLTITVTGEGADKRFFNAKVNYTNKSSSPTETDMRTSHSGDTSTATVTLTDVDENHPVTISGTFEAAFYVTNNLSNCTVQGLKDVYKEGDTLNITATANEGTEFQTPPQISYYLAHGGGITHKDFVISHGKNTASLELSITASDLIIGTGGTLTGGAVPKTVIGGNYGAINVYIVTLDNLNDFAEKRFIKGLSETGEPISEYIDIGKYVNRIKRVHTSIASSSTDTLRCGNYDLNIPVLAPASDKVTLNFGDVTIPAHNGDATDYEGNTQIFLPFVGFVSLDNGLIGKTINLTYIINVITGGGVAKLSLNGTVFNVTELQPSSNVIYRTADTDLQLVGDDDWNEQLQYGLEPYLFCMWYESASNGRNNDRQTGEIGDFRGFNIFDDVEPIHTPEMLAEEQEMIYTALSDGVYIE